VLVAICGIGRLSGRQQRTWLRASLAISRLGMRDWPTAREKYAWLLGDGAQMFRLGILNELSHVTNDESLHRLASVICQQRLSTQEAIAFIRKFRAFRQRSPAKAKALAKVLQTALNGYIRNHPEITRAKMLDALDKLENAIWNWKSK
jgi:hypothetical protein